MKESQRKIKIILINLAIFIAVVGILEHYSYDYIKNFYKQSMTLENKYFEEEHINKKIKIGYKKIRPFNYEEFKKYLRPVIRFDNKKRPLIFMIDSYTNTLGLKDSQLLSYKVANLTKRTTYNRARGGEGAQLILHQLKRKDFYEEIPDAEYIIYTFIYDHIYRLNKFQLAPFNNLACLRYKNKNGKLVEIKPSFLPLYSLFTVQRIQTFIEAEKYDNRKECYDLFYQIMKESLKTAKEHYPDLKFVILIYKDCAWQNSDRYLSAQQIQKLKNLGFIVINAEELVGHELTSDKYRLADKDHPSEKAWDEIAPKLIKELKL